MIEHRNNLIKLECWEQMTILYQQHKKDKETEKNSSCVLWGKGVTRIEKSTTERKREKSELVNEKKRPNAGQC